MECRPPGGGRSIGVESSCDPPPARSRPRGGAGARVRPRRAGPGGRSRGGARGVRELARTAGVEPVAELVQHRAPPRPRTYVGKGKLEELKHAYKESGAESLLVDDELDPAQQRLLENALAGARHRPHAADPRHLRPARASAPRGSSRSSSRSSSTTCRACGACGSTSSGSAAASGRAAPASRSSRPTAGMARRRISLLERRLKELEQAARDAPQGTRSARETPTVALAGYTNVGKSTLLNALTGAEVSVDDRLFETLDPTTRGFEHDGRRYLVTDTVGFIRRLPHQLVEGFAATLEETLVADLVLHVADASAPDDRARRAARAPSSAVLREIGADELPIELVLNKIDARRPARPAPAREPVPGRAAGLGADRRGARRAARAGRGALRRPLRARAAARPVRRGRQARRALRARRRRSRSARTREDGVLVVARLPRRELRRFAPYLVAESRVAAASARDRAADHGGCATTRSCRRAPTPATQGSTSPPASASSSGPGERALVPHRARGRDPGGLRRLRPAALGPRGQARDLDRQHARARRLGLPRRAARHPPQHRHARAVRRRAGHADRAARRPRRSRSRARRGRRAAGRASAASAASGRRAA